MVLQRPFEPARLTGHYEPVIYAASLAHDGYAANMELRSGARVAGALSGPNWPEFQANTRRESALAECYNHQPTMSQTT
jgi:hypothetical protein